MKIMVVDVAAEYGGALTVLNEFIEEYGNDSSNEYVFVLSKPKYKNSDNLRFINLEWVKKSLLHRLWFDSVYIKKLVKKEKPDKIISLQNKAVSVKGINQEVFFHNVLFLSKTKFSFSQSRTLWFYQNVVSRLVRKSLDKASKIYVQAEWIKRRLSAAWKIDPDVIAVKRSGMNIDDKTCGGNVDNGINAQKPLTLFFPTNKCIYKNYENLLRACVKVWEEKGLDTFSLVLTLAEDGLTGYCKEVFSKHRYPVSFVGRLNEGEMDEMYKKSVLVFPSYLESFGLPLLEAKAYGRVILAADCEYAHEAIGDYPNAYYFNPFDVNSIADKIIEQSEKFG